MVFQTALILAALFAMPDAVHLDYRVTVTFNQDGSISERTSTSVIPLNGRGVQKYSSMSVSFRSGMEDIEIIEASVDHWRGGRGSSPAEVSTGPHTILTQTNRFETSLRESVITVPGVEAGDTVRIDILRTIKDLPLSSVYSYTFSPQMEDSVVCTTFRIVNDTGIRLYSSEPGTFFQFSNLSPLPSHPLAFQDSKRISIATGLPETLSMEASTSLDIPWHGEYEGLEEIIENVGRDPGALRSWVAGNINYIGADEGIWPGWSTRSPEETIQDGAGVCRDRAVLLTWLLRKAGFEAYPALLYTRGKTPQVVDARYFDHMITVYRTSDLEQWSLLDPTPRGIPEDAGISFGLRGCSYIPVTPWGEGLCQVPELGWNDTLDISIRGGIDIDEQLLKGTLTAHCNGVPLELVTTLYTQSDDSTLEEMFRRFFGAYSCDSVSFDGKTLFMRGEWRARNMDGRLLLPGLREISIAGTRIASMLLPAPPDSFRIDAPAFEVLDLYAEVQADSVELPLPLATRGYTCSASFGNDSVHIHETASISTRNTDILNSLLLRSGTSARTVVLR